MSLSAPVTAQVREYIAPTVGVAIPASTLTEMAGSNDKTSISIFIYLNFTLTLHSDNH